MSVDFSSNMNRIGESGTLSVFSKVKQMQAKGRKILSLSVGELDCETPDFIKSAGLQAINDGFTRYTVNTGIIELRQAVCKKLKDDNGLDFDPDQIIVSNGSKQAFYNMLYTVVGHGDEVIIFAPNYTSHPDMVKLVGADPVLVLSSVEENYQVNEAALKAAITDRTKMIVVNTPNNPSGQIYTRKSFEIIARAAIEHDLWILTDELYEKIVFDGFEHRTITQDFPEVLDRCLIANGVSKTYAMTGWRVGYGAGPKEVMKKAAIVQSHMTNHACSISQKATLAALTKDDGSFFRKLIPELTAKRDKAYEIINSVDGLTCPNAQGAFYLFPSVTDFLGKRSGDKVINNSVDIALCLLEEKEVAIVPGSAFNLDGAIRISFATDMESIETACHRIKDWFEQLR